MEVNSATYLEFKLLFFKLFFIKKIKMAPINGRNIIYDKIEKFIMIRLNKLII